LARQLAVTFAQRAMHRPVELAAHVSKTSPRYFRVVAGGTSVAYARPRQANVFVEYRIPDRYPVPAGAFGVDGAFGPSVAVEVHDEDSLGVAIRLLDDALSLLHG
jgi:hypothetical protein